MKMLMRVRTLLLFACLRKDPPNGVHRVLEYNMLHLHTYRPAQSWVDGKSFPSFLCLIPCHWLASSVLFSFSLQSSFFIFKFPFFVIRPSLFLDLSRTPLLIFLIPILILFFHFSFFSRTSFLQLSFDLRAIFLLSTLALILERPLL